MTAPSTEKLARPCPSGDEAGAPSNLVALLQQTGDELYSTYDNLRAQSPVHFDPVLGVWVLSRYDDVKTALLDRSFRQIDIGGAVARVATRMGRSHDSLARIFNGFAYFQSGDQHRGSRQALGQALTRPSTTDIESTLEEIIQALLDSLATRGTFDACTDFADVLPRRVLTRILGLPDQDAAFLWRCTIDVSRTFEPATPALYARVDAQVGEALQHLKRRVRDARKKAMELSALDRSNPRFEGEDGVSEAATAMFLAFLMGTETTAAAIGNIVFYLLQHPERYRLWRQDLSCAEGLVNELLRLECPVQRIGRVATEQREIGGRSIEPGDTVVLLIGSANRDALRFDHPGTLNESRRESIVTFGGGMHQCLGANLARLMARAATEAFLRLPRLEWAGAPTRYRGRALPRFTSLPVALAAPSEKA